MKKKTFVIACMFVLLFTSCQYSQEESVKKTEYGTEIRFSSGSAPFPHKDREKGHTYKNSVYPADKHYSDSTVFIFIPEGFQASDSVDVVVYFHGWLSNITNSITKFKLVEQFYRSNKNAIFVFPEGPKDSPDSFGGKLEDKDVFKNLIKEVIDKINEKEKFDIKGAGKIILAGHSGAFRVMAHILHHGGLSEYIKEAILFDALYSQTDKYLVWIEKYSGKFINIYTDDGGTVEQTKAMMDTLSTRNVPFIHKPELEITEDDLINNQLIFIHSDLGHNDVVFKREQFLKFLKASRLTDRNTIKSEE